MQSVYKQYSGKVMIVALGISAKYLLGTEIPKSVKIFGVNDADRVIKPDFLLCHDTGKGLGLQIHKPVSEPEFRLEAIRNTKAEIVFCPKDNFGWGAKCRFYQIGNHELGNMETVDKVDYSVISAFIAAVVAYKMGFTEIGIIGMDFQPTYFDGYDKPYEVSTMLNIIEMDFKNLERYLINKGVKLYNLSDVSKVTTLVYKPLQEFLTE